MTRAAFAITDGKEQFGIVSNWYLSVGHALLLGLGLVALRLGLAAVASWYSSRLTSTVVATVRGYDIDSPSVQMATRNATDAGVSDRVSFTAGDAAGMPRAGFDVAFAFECVHDMPRPVEVLAAVRQSLAPGGFLVVMDEAVAEEFAPDGDDLERLMYGFSLLVCLPDGMSSQPSAGTGTVMRPSVLRGYAIEAGFDDLEVLPIEDFGFWRFYLLT